jgi:hypothetical protein
MRRSLVDGLAEAGRNSPEIFFPFLGDSRWYLVRNTVLILRKIKAPEAGRHLAGVAKHKDPRVRAEVLMYFDELPGEEGSRGLRGFLDDKDQGLRVHAVKALARRGDRSSLVPLEKITLSDEFKDRGLEEREAVYEALGSLDPEKMVPLFGRMLSRRYWFRKGQEWESTACAAAGLRGAGTAEAFEELIRHQSRKKGRPRDIVDRSIERFNVRKAPEGGDGSS